MREVCRICWVTSLARTGRTQLCGEHNYVKNTPTNSRLLNGNTTGRHNCVEKTTVWRIQHTTVGEHNTQLWENTTVAEHNIQLWENTTHNCGKTQYNTTQLWGNTTHNCGRIQLHFSTHQRFRLLIYTTFVNTTEVINIRWKPTVWFDSVHKVISPRCNRITTTATLRHSNRLKIRFKSETVVVHISPEGFILK